MASSTLNRARPFSAGAQCNTPEAQCHGVFMSTPKPLLNCLVRVGAGAALHSYSGLFATTCDAILDAMDRFEDATMIQVREAPK